jgi:Tn3 transposase DDE domain
MARFGSAARGDPLYEVGVGIGRLLRTIFLADYFVKPAFRRELLRVLNRGEATNALKRLIYTDGVAIVRCSPPGSGYSPSSPQLVTSRSTSKKALQLMCPHCLLGGRIPLTARAVARCSSMRPGRAFNANSAVFKICPLILREFQRPTEADMRETPPQANQRDRDYQPRNPALLTSIARTTATLPPCASMSAATAHVRSGCRPWIATAAPSAARARAIASPKPMLLPVTSARFPCNLKSIAEISRCSCE